MHVHRAMLFALAVFFLASCGKTTPTPTPAPTPSTPERDTSTPVKRAASEPEIVKLDASGFKDARIDKGPFRTDAHRKYLSDPMKFTGRENRRSIR